MKISLQILFGLLLSLAGLEVLVSLGLLLSGAPDGRTAIGLLALLAAGQWIALLTVRRQIALQVLFGLGWSAILAIAWLCLGPFWEQLSPDGNSYTLTWRTEVALILLIGVIQWISSYIFRHRIALPILGGLVLLVLFATPLLRSDAAFVWEKHSPDGTFVVGWRSDALFLLLVAVTQGISFFAFRLIRYAGRKRPTETIVSKTRVS